MKTEAWERFKNAARGGDGGSGRRVAALIVDSPWIPGFFGFSHMDYYTLPERWMRANLDVVERFPEVVFIPGFWVEYGMTAEPSGLGCKMVWRQDSTPSLIPAIRDASEVSRLEVPDPSTDGLMPHILNIYRAFEKPLRDRGERIKMVAARGPLAIAGHVRGVTELLMDLKLFPGETKKLLEITTRTAIRWLRAQMENLSEVEGILVLDDIVGFLSPEDYREFAHPLLQEIFSSFPGMVKVYHNDAAHIDRILEGLADTGLEVLNFSHDLDIGVVWEKIGGKVRLMGNVPPLNVLARGRPDEVRSWAKTCIEKTHGGRNLILSAGGGVSPGTPAENIDALVEVAKSP